MTTATSNLGKWNRWYELLPRGGPPQPYGLTPTYQMGADWLADCPLVEDWGCGMGWLRTLIPSHRYRGIDGSRSRFADEIVDLAEYRSQPSGVFMRHVLEHDYRWRDILTNACQSFEDRMALILFTPFSDVTHDLEFEDDPGVPNLSFALADLLAVFAECGVRYTCETVATKSSYEAETVFYLERR